MRTIKLHEFIEEELEAPAIAWRSLAWYWGFSFFGLTPRYLEYINSGEQEIDEAFMADNNDSINQIYGFGKEVTIKQRYNRAIDFYEYCYYQGINTSINAPFDLPPKPQDLADVRRQNITRETIEENSLVDIAINEALKGEYADIWNQAEPRSVTRRRDEFKKRAIAGISYAVGEISPRIHLLDQQLTAQGFMDSQELPDTCAGVTTEIMDEAMPQDTQWNKLGDMTRTGGTGIIGKYFQAGKNLQFVMRSNEELARELTSVLFLTVKSWQQLMEYKP